MSVLLLIGSIDILPYTGKNTHECIAYNDIDSKTSTYLKAHALDESAQCILDDIFSMPFVQENISCIYTGDNGRLYEIEKMYDDICSECKYAQKELRKAKKHAQNITQARNYLNESRRAKKQAKIQWQQECIVLDTAKKSLEDCGFTFLQDKYHVFTLSQLPGYVFKMALPWRDRSEWLNASRIAYAQRIKKVIQQKRLKVKVPQKWAYFMPKEFCEFTLPVVIIAAQQMDLSNQQPLTQDQKDALDVISKKTGFSDDHEDNVIGCGDYAVIVDTEERKYSTEKETFFERFKGAIENIMALRYGFVGLDA